MEAVNIQNLAGIATIAGILFAFWQYRKSLHERQRQILISIKAQLGASSSWSHVDEDGFVGHPSEGQKLNYSRPFLLQLELESAGSKNMITHPGIVDFSDNFQQVLALYNQQIKTMSEVAKLIENLSQNNINDAHIIDKKLHEEYKKSEASRTHASFLESFNSENGEGRAKYLAEKIYSFNKFFRFDLIGSRESGGLKTLHHKLLDELDSQQKKLRNQKRTSYLMLSPFLLLFAYGILSLFGLLQVTSYAQWVLLVIAMILVFVYMEITGN